MGAGFDPGGFFDHRDVMMRRDVFDLMHSSASLVFCFIAKFILSLNSKTRNEVAENYAGIQICPFMLQPLIDFEKINPFTRRLTPDELVAWGLWQDFNQKCYWYHGWDIASGCVWDTSAIQKVILVATKKQRRNIYAWDLASTQFFWDPPLRRSTR